MLRGLSELHGYPAGGSWLTYPRCGREARMVRGTGGHCLAGTSPRGPCMVRREIIPAPLSPQREDRMAGMNALERLITDYVRLGSLDASQGNFGSDDKVVAAARVVLG